MIDIEAARKLISSFQGKLVAVIGDVMLDEFVRGDVSRISPEAPVPVVDYRERTLSPGGAGNAAANVVSLGGRATVIALVGSDAAGAHLRTALDDRGIDTGALVVFEGRPTTHKMRVVAHTQQIVRVDVESRAVIPESIEQELVAAIEAMVARADAVLVSDYAKGVVHARSARSAIASANARKLPIVVDPKGRDYSKYAGATVITPNVLELEMATGTTTHNEDAPIIDAARQLIGQLGGASVLVTRGARGMTLLEQGKEPVHLPTLARSVFDVTGAGDTVVGTLALALAGGASMHDALALASHAARIAVSKPGTVAVGREELIGSFAGETD